MRPKVLIPVLAIVTILGSLMIVLPRRSAPVAQNPEPAVESPKFNSDKSRAVIQSPGFKGGNAQAAQIQDSQFQSAKSEGQNLEPDPVAAARNAHAVARVSQAGISAAHSTSKPNEASERAEQIDEARQMAIETRVQELLDLGMEDDSKSLQTILSELSNANPEIRSAAVEATIQFGSQDAIPELENAMLWAENSEQRKEIANAIEFLKLPKLTEAVAALQLAPKRKSK